MDSTQKTVKYEEYEKLNAQVDVWIDEEESKRIYEQVDKQAPVLELNDSKKVDGLFSGSSTCTNGKDSTWSRVLSSEFPVKKVREQELDEKEPLDQYWSHLFFAKLLRARIMEKGTDCYFRRLDDIIAYLERHLPDYSANIKGGERAKLAVLYLLEVSAAAISSESRGFAERSRRILSDCDSLKDERLFRWFYELLARYNIGVAHFHEASYQKSVLEFNYIIFEIESLRKKDGQMKKEKTQKQKLEFYVEHHGEKLLYLPSVIYRADIQLKLYSTKITVGLSRPERQGTVTR
jgi:hypothetical protein